MTSPAIQPPSAQIDSFVRDRLPAPEHWPDLLFDRPELEFDDRINLVASLFARNAARSDAPMLRRGAT